MDLAHYFLQVSSVCNNVFLFCYNEYPLLLSASLDKGFFYLQTLSFSVVDLLLFALNKAYEQGFGYGCISQMVMRGVRSFLLSFYIGSFVVIIATGWIYLQIGDICLFYRSRRHMNAIIIRYVE